MTPWEARSHEERTLLNPAFCANLLWRAAVGHTSVEGDRLAFEEAFLVLPIVLDRKTREALPISIRTSLASWLADQPLLRGRIASRAQILSQFTKEAILFGGAHGLIKIIGGQLESTEAFEKPIKESLKTSSDEVRECAKKAEFVGKWFAHAGSAATVLALIGVRP